LPENGDYLMSFVISWQLSRTGPSWTMRLLTIPWDTKRGLLYKIILLANLDVSNKYAVDLVANFAVSKDFFQGVVDQLDWRDGMIVLLFKGNGLKKKCGSFRPIFLISVPDKVLK